MPDGSLFIIRGHPFLSTFFTKRTMFACGWVCGFWPNGRSFGKMMLWVYVCSPDYVRLREWMGASASNWTLFVWEKLTQKWTTPNVIIYTSSTCIRALCMSLCLFVQVSRIKSVMHDTSVLFNLYKVTRNMSHHLQTLYDIVKYVSCDLYDIGSVSH